MDDKIKLHLGCGEKYLEGYVNIDFPPSEHSVIKVRADIYKDVRELDYDNDSVDEIRTHHMFEHFPRAEALRILLQWREWLKPGGLLIIETPDFEASILAYLNAITQKRRMEIGRHIFGSQEAKWAYHYDFWDSKKFKYVLKMAGFKNIKIRRYKNSAAKHFPLIPFLSFFGGILPNFLYKNFGGNKYPDIVVTAQKDGAVKLDKEKFIRDVLSNYLSIHDGEKMMNAWLDEKNQP